MSNAADYKQFLIELRQLCVKHGMQISAYGYDNLMFSRLLKNEEPIQRYETLDAFDEQDALDYEH